MKLTEIQRLKELAGIKESDEVPNMEDHDIISGLIPVVQGIIQNIKSNKGVTDSDEDAINEFYDAVENSLNYEIRVAYDKIRDITNKNMKLADLYKSLTDGLNMLKAEQNVVGRSGSDDGNLEYSVASDLAVLCSEILEKVVTGEDFEHLINETDFDSDIANSSDPQLKKIYKQIRWTLLKFQSGALSAKEKSARTIVASTLKTAIPMLRKITDQYV